MHPLLPPLIALLAGIAILVQPKFLNYIVAIYLIVVGVLGLAPQFNMAPGPILAIVAGILILVRPQFLNYIVAIYLIIIGLLGIFPGLRV